MDKRGQVSRVSTVGPRGEFEFRGLAESLPVIAWTADSTGSFNWYNQKWYDYTGQRPDEAIGWGWQTVHHPEDFLEVMQRWPECVSTGEPFEMELRLRAADGTFHWFLSRAAPFRGPDGKVERWYGINVDIDAQRSAVERMRRIANTLQLALLPQQLPQREDRRLDSIYIPAEKDALVGGDWFDAFELAGDRLVISIGDVTGHGLGASITAARLRQAIYTLALLQSDPAAIVTQLDHTLSLQDPGTIATAIVAIVDRSNPTKMSYCNAGHPPPMIARERGTLAELLQSGELPLGVGLRSDLPRTTRVALVPNDSVIAFYTDGLVEFDRNIIDNEAKLQAALGLLVADTTIAEPAQAIADIMLEGQAPTDDAALLILALSSLAEHPRWQSEPLEKIWRFHSSIPQAAQDSRLEIMEYLRSYNPNDPGLFDAELIIGEIFANTVLHAPSLVEVRVEWTGRHPVLTAVDEGPGMTAVSDKLPSDPLSRSGRGMFLIMSLAKDVHFTARAGRGTRLRVVLPLERKSPEEAG